MEGREGGRKRRGKKGGGRKKMRKNGKENKEGGVEASLTGIIGKSKGCPE